MRPYSKLCQLYYWLFADIIYMYTLSKVAEMFSDYWQTHKHPKKMMLCRFNAVEQDYNEHICNMTTGQLTEHVIKQK